MSFLHLSLLAGSAMVAVPIVLHLIMRRKPVRLEFPALRLIEKRADVNRRRLQLRHLLLLLLRAAAIALLSLALARPTVKWGGAAGSQEKQVAAALVFDAAPRMEYRHQNRTRLDVAREMGQWLVSQLPEGSPIAVLDTRPGSTAALHPDPGAAKERIARLESVSNSQPLTAAVEAAAKLLAKSDLRKEIYVLTDLSRGAWPAEQAASLRQQLAAAADCGLYVIDVGAAHPADFALGEIRLSDDVLSARSTLRMDTDLSCLGTPAARTVELYVSDARGNPQKRDERTCKPGPGEAQRIEFRLGALEPGIHQGSVRIVGEDGLAADDVRYFTVKVKPAWHVLLAAAAPADTRALFLSQALAPEDFRRRGHAWFDCDVCNFHELSARPLADDAAVCLLDPTPLDPAVWKKLTDFAADGHGVAIFLGRHAMPIESFNEPQAQQLLAGKLLRQTPRPDGDVWLAPGDYQHPILAKFRGLGGSVPWEKFPVFRYWELDRGAAASAGGPGARGATESSVVVPYNDGRPALLERPVGRGRALTMTTPISAPASELEAANPWNLLPVPAGEAWPFVILANQMAAYLVGSNTEQLNYYAGQTAIVELDDSARRQSYMLSAPGDLNLPYPADIGRSELAITATDRPGNYRLEAGGTGGTRLGFSVNYAPEQTRLDRLSDKDLADLLGPVKFRLARTREQLDRDVSQGRVGRELFPPLVLLIALVVALEMVVANRFYKE
jgi:hypothetical protein